MLPQKRHSQNCSFKKDIIKIVPSKKKSNLFPQKRHYQNGSLKKDIIKTGLSNKRKNCSLKIAFSKKILSKFLPQKHIIKITLSRESIIVIFSFNLFSFKTIR